MECTHFRFVSPSLPIQRSDLTLLDLVRSNVHYSTSIMLLHVVCIDTGRASG